MLYTQCKSIKYNSLLHNWDEPEQAPYGCDSCRKSLAALLVWLPTLHGHLTCMLCCMLHLNRDHFHLEFTKLAK